MSSDADTAAATVMLFDALYTGGYCALTASVLFIYDTFITFDREVAYFWAATKPSGASLLFFANKWISITYYVMVMVSFDPFPSDESSDHRDPKRAHSCSNFVKAQQAMLLLQFAPAAAFSALRAYVLSRSKFLGVLVFALSLAPVGVNLVKYGYQLSGINFPPFGCNPTDNTTAALDLRLTIIARLLLIASDSLLIYITWSKLSRRDALRDIRQLEGLSLSAILFCGGILYFVYVNHRTTDVIEYLTQPGIPFTPSILFILEVLHLVFTATVLAGTSVNGSSVVTAFTGPITAVLISRFLLELQETDRMVVRLDPNDPSYSSRNRYDSESTPSFISSLGGFVNPDLLGRSDDNELHLESRGEEEDGAQAESEPQAPVLSSLA